MQRQRPASPGMFVAVGAAFVLAVGLTVFMAYIDISYSSQVSAYDSAPLCSTTANISGCRFQDTAQVVRQYMDRSHPALDLTFSQLGAQTYSADVDTSYTAQWQAWKPGSTVTAELWHGVVTQVGGLKTTGNPDALPNLGLLPVFVFGGVALVCAGLVLWLQWLNRRARA
jgi:hypothetical protein